jgi:alkylation response protein AidB-like acyl-CoA dehydrogenase
MMTAKKPLGGSFLWEETDPNSVTTPEDLTDEQKMIYETARSFYEREIVPNEEQIEKLDYELTRRLLRKAGEQGLLAVEVPEPFGGLGLDKITGVYVGEVIARSPSFSLSLGGHVGIGTLPIVFFGSKEQKEKYLPLLASGEKIAAYCLTEPSSGSDALSAKTTAKLSEDGKYYILNGSKMFITNAGFADIFIVYAKVDGEHFSAFIVERGMEGFTVGPEEKKMGIKGSSTCPLFFENVKVPVENLLYEVGKGHHIAFNILNIGRFKLGTGAVGVSKEVIELSASYGNQRKQFGQPLTRFPLIARKLADMNIAVYAMESILYRTAGLLEEATKDIDPLAPDVGRLSSAAIGEYAVECSINKVFATESLDFVVDEGVQIHGGYGYTQEYKVEKFYRDSRINRIFEGTNEINRLLIPGTLAKRAVKGELPLFLKAMATQSEMSQFKPQQEFSGLLAREDYLLGLSKKAALLLLGLAAQTYGKDLEREQEVLAALADIVIRVYVMDSVLARTRKLIGKVGEEKAVNAVEMTQVIVQEGIEDIIGKAKLVVTSAQSGGELNTSLKLLAGLGFYPPANLTALKRRIASRVIEAEKYVV